LEYSFFRIAYWCNNQAHTQLSRRRAWRKSFRTLPHFCSSRRGCCCCCCYFFCLLLLSRIFLLLLPPSEASDSDTNNKHKAKATRKTKAKSDKWNNKRA